MKKPFVNGVLAFLQTRIFFWFPLKFSQGRFLGRDKLQNIFFRLLLHASDRFPDYQQRFGTLTDFEFDQHMALTSEVEHGEVIVNAKKRR